MNNNSAVSPEELAAFVAVISETVLACQKERNPTCDATWTHVELAGGRKYAKLVSVLPYSGGRSAYCFIDLRNGDILMAASWKAPAKGVRGNIRTGNASNWFNGALNWHGAAYLR